MNTCIMKTLIEENISQLGNLCDRITLTPYLGDIVFAIEQQQKDV